MIKNLMLRSDETAAFLFTGNPSRKQDPCRPFLAHVKRYILPYSGFYVRGPNFYEICEWARHSQIFPLNSYVFI